MRIANSTIVKRLSSAYFLLFETNLKTKSRDFDRIVLRKEIWSIQDLLITLYYVNELHLYFQRRTQYNSIVLFYWISTMLYILNKAKQKVFLLKRLTRTQNMTECVMTRHSEPMCEISYQILQNGHSPHTYSSQKPSHFPITFCFYQSHFTTSINFDF